MTTVFSGDVLQHFTACHRTTDSLSNSPATCKMSRIVKVFLFHRDNFDHETFVHAMLDTQSDSTFVLEDTFKAFGLPCVNVKLSHSTMHSENQVVDSKKR